MHRKIIVVTVLILWSFGAFSQDVPLKRLYLGNDTHTDLLWNGGEEYWYKLNLDMAKFYLKIGEETATNAPEARSKWNYDVAWTLYMIEKNESPEFFNHIIDQIKKGQASVPYNFTLPVYGASTAESILRSFYYGGYLERKYGIDIDMAMCQENATIPLGLASLWAGSGAKYSWRGVCNCATKINTIGPRDHEIYWYTGLDDSKILMKWYSNYGWNAELGGYAEMLEPTVAVIQMDTLTDSQRYPYRIAGAFGKGWDNMYNYSLDLVWGLNHRTLPGTKLFLSNQLDFFKDFENTYGSQLPAVSESYGNEWDLNLASLAETSGKLKRSMEKLRTAESLAAIVSVDNNTVFDGLRGAKEDFLYGISVYNVHGWTADGPVDRHDFATYMRQQQQKVTDYVDTLMDYSLNALGSTIHSGNLENVVFVFNALNWQRNGLVDIPVTGVFNAVKDLNTGKTYRGLLIEKEGANVLRVWVDGIPSVGYRLFQLINMKPKAEKVIAFSFDGKTIETPYYTATISRSGAISALYDKDSRKTWSKGQLNDLGNLKSDSGAVIVVEEQSDDHITLLCRSTVPVAHTSRITFYAHDKRIDFSNTILQNFKDVLSYTFDFNVENPEVWHEEVGAIIKAKTRSQGGHYADRMARYDYLTLNHFVNVGSAKESITLSNADCLFFKLGDSTPDFLDASSSEIHVLAGGQVNDNLGMLAQDGDTVFHQHFSLLPQNDLFDAGKSMRFALQHQNDLVAGTAERGGLLSEKPQSFLTTTNKDILLWTLKPGEDDGIALRFWNMKPAPSGTELVFNRDILGVRQATHVETPMGDLPFTVRGVKLDFRKHELKTFLIKLK